MVITRKSDYREHTDINVVREKLKRAKDCNKLHDRENRKRARRSVMKNNDLGFMNIQLFAEDPAGAETPKTDTPPQVDYEAEYKKMVAERDSYKAEAEKQKGLKDKYATENAEYKKKELDKMSDDEKKEKEYQDLVKSNNALAEELKTIKLERELMGEGFTAEECKKLIDDKFAPKTLAEILKTRVTEAVKSAGAGQIKEGTPSTPLGKGTVDGGEEKSDFAKRQEARTSQNGSKKVEL